MRCFVQSCDADMHGPASSGFSTHRFPKDEDHRLRWWKILCAVPGAVKSGTKLEQLNSARLCSRHFRECDIRQKNGKRELKRDAVPRLFLHENDYSIDSSGSFELPYQVDTEISSDGFVVSASETSSQTISSSLGGVPTVPEQFNSSTCSRKTIRYAGDVTSGDIRQENGKRALSDYSLDSSGFSSSRSFELPYQVDTEISSDSILVSASETSSQTISSSLGDVSTFPEQLNNSTCSRKTIRYAGDVTDFENITLDEAKAVLPKYRKQLHDALKRVNRYKQQNYRLKKKLNKLETIINELKRQKIISTQGAVLLKQHNSDPELLKELSKGPGGSGYKPVVRSFATTVFFYSAKAYNYIREAFDFTLPHPSTIIRWYRVIDGNPGLTTEALQVLEVKAAEKDQEGLPLLVGLSYDECAMRQQVTWNQYEKKFDGKVEFGSDLDDDDGDIVKPAREILVFMVTAVDESWKIPVAYYVTSGVNVEKKKGLVENVLRALQEINVKVIGLTFDGTSTNIGVANALGCHIRGDRPLRTSFQHPSGTHQVYVFLDACHMIKLVRNVFASQKTLRTATGNVEWKLIEKLVEKQELHGLKLAEKLTEKHVKFESMKMKVLLAVQLLSDSTGNALEQLKEIDAEFADCDATVEFVRIFNDVFDILNSRVAAGDGLKRPLSEENVAEVDKVLEKAERFIRTITVESIGKPILQTTWKTGFLGILVDINSIREMYQEYVSEKHLLDQIPTYQFSQDHVEMFFGAARAKGGCNDNPNFGQFKAAYRRLLNDNSIAVSTKANILEISQVNILPADVIAERGTSIRKMDQGKDQRRFKEIEMKLLDGLPPEVGFVDDKFVNAAIEVDARKVQKELLRKVHCQDCLQSILIHDHGSYLSDRIVQICRFSEMQFGVLTGGHNAFNVGKYYELLIACSVARVEKDFPEIVDMRAHPDHKHILLKVLMEIYFNIRLTRYSQQMLPSRISIRPKLNKIVHFSGY